ncbi:MAG: protein phosphatase 2C domain-containing protein [Pseudomonadota bacterium]
MIAIQSAGLTDVGRKRKGNEDRFSLNDDLGLYIVADGMGGHAAGEVASRIVVNTMNEYMNRFQEDEDAEELEGHDQTLSREANRLLAGIHLANRSIYQLSEKNKKYHGMGSTVSAILFAEHTCIAANVGDSPIYLIRDGEIDLLSVLHTVQAEHMAFHPDDLRKISVNFNHVLTRGMGINETVKPDFSELQILNDDILIICSDGLSDKVTPTEIRDVALTCSPKIACENLIRMANDRGGDDNITLIVIKVRNSRSIIFQLKKIIGRFIRKH